MKKLFTLLALATLATCLASCAGGPRENVGAVTGGVAGGILGSTLFHGQSKAIGAGVGAIIGTMAGSSIGRSMDRQDQINAAGAYGQVQRGNIPIGREASWTNPRTQTSYAITPTSRYTRGNVECMTVKTKVYRRGRSPMTVTRTIYRKIGTTTWHQL